MENYKTFATVAQHPINGQGATVVGVLARDNQWPKTDGGAPMIAYGVRTVSRKVFGPCVVQRWRKSYSAVRAAEEKLNFLGR